MVRTASPTVARDAEPPRLRDGMRFCLAVFLAARVLLSLTAVAGVGALPESPLWRRYSFSPAEERATPGWHNALDGTFRWDASSFALIAQHGYRESGSSAAFYPTYPFTMWVLGRATGMSMFTAGIVVSNLSFLCALVILYSLTTFERTLSVARRTVVLIAFSPTSFFFLAPFSESLFMLLTLLAFWFVRRNRWGTSGLSGALAAATRGVGITLALALAVEALSRPWADRSQLHRRLAASALVLLGPLAYAAGWLIAAGAPLQPWTSESGVGRGFVFPLLTLERGFRVALTQFTRPERITTIADALLTGIALLLLAVGWRTLRGSYRTYVGLSLLIPLSFTLQAPPLPGLSRYVIVLFPLFWVAAEKIRRRAWFATTVAVSVVGYMTLAVMFMNWRFVA